MSEVACCKSRGPGYKSPMEALRGPREKIIYTVLVHCGVDHEGKETPPKPDALATVDVDPSSHTYTHILNTLHMPYTGDELHHFGWNACSSCCDDASKTRRFLVLPGLKSSRVYIVDTATPCRPAVHKIIEPEEIAEKANLSAPHTVHCLADGHVMISFLGDKHGEAPGGFLLLTAEFEIVRRYGASERTSFNYDFWYQPRHNVMVSSEWAAPNTFRAGFKPEHVAEGKYGQSVHFWNWTEEKIVKSVSLGNEGLIPLELRFAHDPASTHGYVGAALSSAVWHWTKSEAGEWVVQKVVQVDPVEMDSWPMPVPGLITDILLSLDDKFCYFSNWLHGDIRQYDISDPGKPKLVGQVWCGGVIGKEVRLKDRKLEGGPQMIQLSLDGERLYVTNSLYSAWDDQFYPGLAKSGSYMLRVNCDTKNGGLSIDEDFYVDFGKVENGPYRAHEMRYPGGDCTSDIWL